MQAAARQLRPAVLSPAPAASPVDRDIGRPDAQVPGSGDAQQSGAEQGAVAVGGALELLRAGKLDAVEKCQVLRAKVVNPADMHFAHRGGRPSGPLACRRLIHDG